MTDIEKIIAEHAENMPHGEFTHESECVEHEEWFKKDVREIVNLARQEYESLPKIPGELCELSCSLVLLYNLSEMERTLKEAGFKPGDKVEMSIRKVK